MHFKKGLTVSIFIADKLTTSPMQGTSGTGSLATVKKLSHIILTVQCNTGKILQTLPVTIELHWRLLVHGRPVQQNHLKILIYEINGCLEVSKDNGMTKFSRDLLPHEQLVIMLTFVERTLNLFCF